MPIRLRKIVAAKVECKKVIEWMIQHVAVSVLDHNIGSIAVNQIPSIFPNRLNDSNLKTARRRKTIRWWHSRHSFIGKLLTPANTRTYISSPNVEIIRIDFLSILCLVEVLIVNHKNCLCAIFWIKNLNG